MLKRIVLIAALPLLAQSPAPAPAPVPILRSTTRLVQINVIAQDKSGEPVTDLTKDDFAITEKGKPQQIAVFSMESSAVDTKTPPVALPPNIFMNRLSRRTGVPNSVTVILLDGLNTRFEDQAYARAQVVKFLTEQLHPQDHVALYTLGNGIRVLHDFTTDSQSLIDAVAKYRPRIASEQDASAPQPPDTGSDDLDTLLASSAVLEADFYMMDRVHRTMAAIELIAKHLDYIPGRKNLVWVSGSFPLSIGFDSVEEMQDPKREHRVFSEELDRAVRALNHANLAVYPVDARGLVGSPQFSAQSRIGPVDPRRPQSLDPRFQVWTRWKSWHRAPGARRTTTTTISRWRFEKPSTIRALPIQSDTIRRVTWTTASTT